MPRCRASATLVLYDPRRAEIVLNMDMWISHPDSKNKYICISIIILAQLIDLICTDKDSLHCDEDLRCDDATADLKTSSMKINV